MAMEIPNRNSELTNYADPVFKKEALDNPAKHKAQLSLLDTTAMHALAKVLEHGAEKYGRDNWKRCTFPRVYIDAALRHLMALNDGELIDSDSGLPHADHLLCNAMFLSYFHNKKE